MEGAPGQSGMIFDPAFDGAATGQSLPGQVQNQNEMKMQTPNLFAPGNAPFMPVAGAGAEGPNGA